MSSTGGKVTLRELEKIVAERESSSLEFKRTTGQRSDACKALTGMLNGSGGRVLFGVAPNGDITGQDVSDRTLEQLSAELSFIEPTVLPSIESVDLPSGKSVISVSVGNGQLRPYEYRGKAYKRVGNTTLEMGHHEREQMLLERMHGTSRWENQPLDGWEPSDLDGDEIRKTIGEAVRRGRLEDPGSTDARERSSKPAGRARLSPNYGRSAL
jgi:ATP-dependent DNA helicase RecG